MKGKRFNLFLELMNMKKLIGLLLVSIMVLVIAIPASAWMWTVYSPSEYTMMGDMNIDKKIDAKDALEVLKFSVYGNHNHRFPTEKPSPEQLLKWEREDYYKKTFIIVADVNGDEKVNAEDALHILQYAVGKRNVFENNDISRLQNLVYPQLVPNTPTDITPTDQ